ncbi:uncharacterized protein SCODWIG_03347 [Saccharomycodes ludwigii]|uniref:CAP-Gly domain-containing protein n=1 Tax=Saccharomycodes ludwigii TaxID=36035 RepID=A0A376BA88_9ASCO|nr:uncharacterized protein SCODWIG_03347 [Saccharomycodes ludwigii]
MDASKVKLNNRLTIGENTCTIRFIGRIPQWPHDVAIGVEWDNIERGKNDGSLDGIQYFQTRRRQKSGSFFKKEKLLKELENSTKVNNSKTLSDHLSLIIQEENLKEVEKSDNSKHDLNGIISFGLKNVEFLGFDTTPKETSHRFTRTILDLSGKNISQTGDLDSAEVKGYFQKVEYLDLSDNFLFNFQDVIKIIDIMPNLQVLKLDGNKFKVSSIAGVHNIIVLKKLSLAGCTNSEDFIKFVVSITKIFRCDNYDFSNNALDNTCTDNQDNLTININCKVLDLSYNKFTKFPLLNLDSSSIIEELLIHDNKIEQVDNSTTFSAIRNIKSLDLRYNKITDWQFIDKLRNFIPNLKKLRIVNNPIVFKYEEMFPILVPRLPPSLIELDGSAISSMERADLELHFVNSVKKGEILYAKETEHWNYLCEKHKVTTSILPMVVTTDSFLSQMGLIKLRIMPFNFDIYILDTCTVRYLKTVIRTQLKRKTTHYNIPYSIIKIKDIKYAVVHDTLETFINEFSPLSYYNLQDGDIIHVILG